MNPRVFAALPPAVLETFRLAVRLADATGLVLVEDLVDSSAIGRDGSCLSVLRRIEEHCLWLAEAELVQLTSFLDLDALQIGPEPTETPPETPPDESPLRPAETPGVEGGVRARASRAAGSAPPPHWQALLATPEPSPFCPLHQPPNRARGDCGACSGAKSESRLWHRAQAWALEHEDSDLVDRADP